MSEDGSTSKKTDGLSDDDGDDAEDMEDYLKMLRSGADDDKFAGLSFAISFDNIIYREAFLLLTI